jgi:hypothetical protein
MSMPENYLQVDHPVGEAKPKEIVQELKAQVPGCTTLVLKNGDVIMIQLIVKEVRRVVGQKDAKGRNVYNFEWGVGTDVITRD